MLKETLRDAEPPRVLSEMIAESYIAAQSAPIKLECLLSASRKESLFDEQFVLIQKYRSVGVFVGRVLRLGASRARMASWMEFTSLSSSPRRNSRRKA